MVPQELTWAQMHTECPAKLRNRTNGAGSSIETAIDVDELDDDDVEGYLEGLDEEVEKNADGPTTEIQERRRVPVSPSKRQGRAGATSRDPPSRESSPDHESTMEVDEAELPSLVQSDDEQSDGTAGSDDDEESGSGSDSDEEGEKKPRALRESDRPFLQWIPHIPTFVDELLRHEGPGTSHPDEELLCQICLSSGKTVSSGSEDVLVGHGTPQLPALAPGEAHRCRDCHPGVLCRAPCMRAVHANHPFHRIETWTGTFFSRSSLKAIGFRIQLNHPPGETCCARSNAANESFVVIDSEAIHTVILDYCGCERAVGKVEQLLRYRLFPATTTNPRTAATFRNRNKAWLRMVREWRHVRLLKRKGRGHIADGIQNPAPGDCAVLCPACPYPGINMPEKLDDIPLSERWLFAVFIAIDANFRLRRKDVSSDSVDPTLNAGRAYVVNEREFREHLEKHGSMEDDKSTCNNHDAIKSASMRGGKGTAASGMGSAQCGRHDMKRPCGVGDLQKGERYVNMDYFFISTLFLFALVRLIVTYDIACQWSKNLHARCAAYAKTKPNTFSEKPDLDIKFAVPKFHLPAHIPACQLQYSLNRLPGVGRTDGECPERLWSTFNGLAYSTREMGPGSRRDTLDDNFGDHNWRKTTELPETFAGKSVEAIAMRIEQIEEFASVTSGVEKDTIKEFTAKVKAWEADSSQPNPYKGSADVISANSVRLQLAAKDAERSKENDKVFLHREVTPSLLIYQGIEIEDQQRRLAFDNEGLGEHATDLQKAKILERTASLQRKITAFISIQHLYVPALAIMRKEQEEDGEVSDAPAVWDIPLYLPSSTTPTPIPKLPMELIHLEYLYRQAQGYSSLRELRALLLLQVMMTRSKKKYVSGNRMLTRSRKVLENVRTRIERTADKYRMARTCMERLGVLMATNSWQSIFPELERDDVRTLTVDEDAGEGRKKLSWIWKVKGASITDSKEVQCELRIEWCKARARVHRWQEECLLLAEEMRRVKAFFEWEISTWDERRSYATKKHSSYVIDPSRNAPALVQKMYNDQHRVVDMGRMAYAARQADIRRRMLKLCRARWSTLDRDLKQFSRASSENLANLPVYLCFSGTEMAEIVYEES
ncbi:hypothetical protein NMY22_g5368 [Coprinellus aureogranulatus]|nr:hypothetical protein NMY22_g5368 [Coprinellus aureogranulatus]